MNIISKLLVLVRKFIIKVAIRLKLPLKARAKFSDKTVTFHDASSSYITEQILLNGAYGYEYELAQFIKNFPFNFNTFIDGGANIGFYSALTESVYGDKVNVIAVEAGPSNVSYLQKLKKENGFDFKIIDRAIAEKADKELEFYLPTSHRSSKFPPAASLVNSFKGSGGVHENSNFKTIKVKTCSLQDIIEQNEGPYFIKLDIEGYELPVLQSLKSTLKNADNIDLVVEIMINDKDKDDVFGFLTECGYTGYLITNAGLLREDRPLTLPYHNMKIGQQRTCWKNHFFTKRDREEVERLSKDIFGYFI